MTEPGPRRGRTHDAEGAREAILDAAEAVFAEHGFDGARVDAIAAAAHYNKSLIFQYFGDKLGLYNAVIRRADDQTREMQIQVIGSLLDDEVIFDAHKVRTLLETFLGAYFDYLVEHPRIARIYVWEMAEGWQTYAKILSQRDYEDVEQFGPLLLKLQNAGMMRSGINPMMQIMLVFFLGPVYLALVPMAHIMLPGTDFSSPAALAAARQYITDFIVRGIMANPVETKPQKGD